MNTAEYLSKKSGVVFDFLDLNNDGILTLDEMLYYPTQLRQKRYADQADVMLDIYTELFRRVSISAGKTGSTQALRKDEFIRGADIVRKTGWFKAVFLETITDIFFDTVDKNHDGQISVNEWREMYRLRGITDENFIQSTFAKLDRDCDGLIEKEEFKYAYYQFGINEDQSQDFSFLYDKKTSNFKLG